MFNSFLCTIYIYPYIDQNNKNLNIIRMKVSIFYDYDSIKIYDSGSFNQQFKTDLKNKIKIIDKASLPEYIVNSFLNGEYYTCTTTEEFYLYRVYGLFKNNNGQTKGAKVNVIFNFSTLIAFLLPIYEAFRG